MMIEERRSRDRFNIAVPTVVEVKDKDMIVDVLNLMSRDISKNGAFLKTTTPLPEGTSIMINMMLKINKLRELNGHGQVAMQVAAKVKRCDQYGMALCFAKHYKLVRLGLLRRTMARLKASLVTILLLITLLTVISTPEVLAENSSDLWQSGSENEITASQSFVELPDNGHFNEIDVIQHGKMNSAMLTQFGAGNNIDLLQNGHGNSTEIDQSGWGNFVDLRQSGSENYVSSYQNGGNNYSRSTQQGSDNQVIISQYGDSNAIIFLQQGHGNNAEVTQTSY